MMETKERVFFLLCHWPPLWWQTYKVQNIWWRQRTELDFAFFFFPTKSSMAIDLLYRKWEGTRSLTNAVMILEVDISIFFIFYFLLLEISNWNYSNLWALISVLTCYMGVARPSMASTRFSFGYTFRLDKAFMLMIILEPQKKIRTSEQVQF